MAKASKGRNVLGTASELIRGIRDFAVFLDSPGALSQLNAKERARLFDALGQLARELDSLREKVSPAKLGEIEITLGNPNSIAKFFAFLFINQPRSSLSDLADAPFYGSGIYSIYYVGKEEPAYQPIANTETPIYLGKADPGSANTFAETPEEQGFALFKRLSEHAKNIAKTNLRLEDFEYRAAPIQSGMQAAVEHFLIGLFRPIWNKETKVCFGLGKHGDSAKTRANKRSPWDTMHPGRKWAKATKSNQKERKDIEAEILAHFENHPPIGNKEALLAHLATE